MTFTIENKYKDIRRIRVKFENGVFTVIWPEGLNIEEHDREFKIHSAIKRCFAHQPMFKIPGVVYISNIQVNRLDSFDAIDLYWEEKV